CRPDWRRRHADTAWRSRGSHERASPHRRPRRDDQGPRAGRRRPHRRNTDPFGLSPILGGNAVVAGPARYDGAMSMEHTVSFNLNGDRVTASVEPRMTLGDCIRHKLGRTGTHIGCEHGVCGACTVIVDGDPVRSCLMLAVQDEGTAITTIEGLANGARVFAVQ